MSTEYERETVVNASDGDDLVRIYTQQRRYITRLRRNPRFTEIGHGIHNDGGEWAEFTIPASEWAPDSGAIIRKNLTPAQRDQLRSRMARLRQAATESEGETA